MNAQNVMEEWETSPFDGGFDGLRDLRSRRFSGAVEAGGSWLFLRDGEPLAVVDDLEVDPRPGEVDAFEDASGRAHEATQPATATLAAMLALGGEVRGQYFTEDTPLSTVHETLSDGGFTGYVELSENVLSGDYYVVYEDGDEDYLGILGSSNRLITDDEAQSKAEGEVGIYSVVAVRFPDVEIPEAESTTTDAAGTVAAGAAGAGEAADSTAVEEPGLGDTDSGLAAGPGSEPEADVEPGASARAEEPADPEPAIEEEVPEPDAGTSPDPEPETEPESEPEPEPEPESQPGAEAETTTNASVDAVTEPDEGADPAPGPAPGGESDVEPGPDSPTARSDEPTENPDSIELEDTAGSEAGPGPSGPDRNGSSEPDLDGVTTRAVPSLDPERTGRAESSRPSSYVQSPDSGSAADAESTPEPDPEPRAEQVPDTVQQPNSGADAGPEPEPADDDRVEAVREEYEGRIDELESELESLREERDRLQRRVSELESSGAESASGGSSGTSLSPAEALAGTSLFVREGTRGEATLEDAHDGRTDRETLAKNLRIEYHTQFDDATATVDGESFESWLRSTPRYDFVEWLIQDLLFEIQSTGSASGLRPLYDAIPLIDRVGFDDAVTVGEGEEGREITFDVVARNQMGEPLIAADIDEGRDPTRAESIQPLIGDAEDVSMDHDTLAATFAVTSSYFEPDALDAAREATSGSLLGREKYRSYVKLARKNGFHLCLVESREESFHLAVPEL